MLNKIKLYYDKECPFCNEYSKYVELRKVYDMEIINAREALDKVKDYKDKGFDINNGMIIEFEDKFSKGGLKLSRKVHNKKDNRSFTRKSSRVLNLLSIR